MGLSAEELSSSLGYVPAEECSTYSLKSPLPDKHDSYPIKICLKGSHIKVGMNNFEYIQVGLY